MQDSEAPEGPRDPTKKKGGVLNQFSIPLVPQNRVWAKKLTPPPKKGLFGAQKRAKNGPKMAQKWPKMAKNGQKWPKMAILGGQKWRKSRKWQKRPKIQGELQWKSSQFAKNTVNIGKNAILGPKWAFLGGFWAQKWPKKGQKWPKMAKNGVFYVKSRGSSTGFHMKNSF